MTVRQLSGSDLQEPVLSQIVGFVLSVPICIGVCVYIFPHAVYLSSLLYVCVYICDLNASVCMHIITMHTGRYVFVCDKIPLRLYVCRCQVNCMFYVL
jgi:hypothetical protein